MDFVDVIVYTVMVLFFWSLATRILNYLLIKKIKNTLRDNINDLIHEVNVEEHGPTSYWFDKETGNFLGQGKDDGELIDHVKSRFPGHIFIVPEKGFLSPPDWTFKTNNAEIQISKIIKL
jgi:hypothetical protein